jgi:FkbM family methyltransferase
MTVFKLVSKVLNMVPLSVRRHIKRVPGIAQIQGRLVSALFDGQEFIHLVDAGPAKGISFPIRLPEDKGIWTGTYEFDFARRLAAAVRPGAVGYDIGGWHGFFAGVMAAKGAGEVHVFEPLPLNAERIRKLIELNSTKSIVLHTFAIGESDTEMNLLVMPETSMAKLEVSDFQGDAASQQKVRVRVRSLDSILRMGEAPPPSLVKIDVEGAELFVLQGARATLRDHRPEIFAEIHSAALLQQCTEFLTSEGYRIERLDVDPAAVSSKDICQIRAFARAVT